MRCKMKRIVYIFLVLAMILSVFPLTSCDETEATKLSFKSALSYDYLKSIDGKTVTINGYLATSSPADGSFIFLMNIPRMSGGSFAMRPSVGIQSIIDNRLMK